jgi:hypothetical protein
VICPLCGAPTTEAAFAAPDRNRGIGETIFHYRRCVRCRCYVLADPPADLGAHYPPEYYALPSLEGLRAQAAEERYRMDLLSAHVAPGGRLVEIGPGNGIFAVQALDAGFETAAIERDAQTSAYLRATLGIEVVQSEWPERALAQLPPSRAIAMWHVLEHVARPWELLDAAAANLEPGGVVLIATPNPRAAGLRLLRGRWPHVDAPRHLFLLDHAAVIARGRAAGLEPVLLTATDPGGLQWNAFAWHYVLRRARSRYPIYRAAQVAGRAIAAALAPLERHGLRGAAYTLILRKR